MLVLSRKLGESIVVDGSITVTVLDLSRGRVRLGIEAPPAVAIHRHELLAANRPHPLPAETPCVAGGRADG